MKHMVRYHPDWRVYVIEQDQDGRKFNRGALLNVGAVLAEKDHHQAIIFHDVDLIPLAAILPYYYAFPEAPIHIGKAWTTKYDYDSFLGGILSMSLKDFKQVNGFPNQFWGWGGEDDALRNRLAAHSIRVLQPTLRNKGIKELPHVHTKTQVQWTNMRKWEDLAADHKRPTGLKEQRFRILGTKTSGNFKLVTVHLH